jgi:phage terminase small subunit
MGKRGPRPTPTKQLVNRGSKLAIHRTGEPTSGLPIGACPDWLDSMAAEKWNSLVPRLERLGIINEADAETVSQYCFWWSKFMWLVTQCPNDLHMQGKATEHLMRLGSRLGLSPADRVGLKTEKQDKGDRFLKVV